MKLKFLMTIKQTPGRNDITAFRVGDEIPEVQLMGLELDAAHVTVAQLQEVPELEAKLEALTGLRFHIDQVG